MQSVTVVVCKKFYLEKAQPGFIERRKVCNNKEKNYGDELLKSSKRLEILAFHFGS